MYRHSLIHEDRPRSAKSGKKIILWSISLGNLEVEPVSDKTNVFTPDLLYERLMDLIKQKFETTKRKYVSTEDMVVFCKNVRKNSPILREVHG
jgi:hypothetical protein